VKTVVVFFVLVIVGILVQSKLMERTEKN
jgi:hypothetical protein